VRHALAPGGTPPTAATPGALLRNEVAWRDEDDDRAGARLEIDGEPYEVHLDLDPSGQLLAASIDRWGDPGGGEWRLLPFGALFEEERTFDGVTIPSRGRVGWWLGTERWPEGEFFHFEIEDASFEAGPAPA
jgi:hypothetical protein